MDDKRIAAAEHKHLIPLDRINGYDVRPGFYGINGAVIGAGGAEELRRVGLALGDDALGFVQLVCARNFGDVQLFTAQRAAALVARHMHPGGALLGVATDKIDDILLLLC